MAGTVGQLIAIMEEALVAMDNERFAEAAELFKGGQNLVLSSDAENDNHEEVTQEQIDYARRLQLVCDARIVEARDDAKKRLGQVNLQSKARRVYQNYGRR